MEHPEVLTLATIVGLCGKQWPLFNHYVRLPANQHKAKTDSCFPQDSMELHLFFLVELVVY